MPISVTVQGKRNSTREYLCQTLARYTDRLFLKTNAFVTKILFDANQNAIGVEYQHQAHAYDADRLHNPDARGTPHLMKAKYEVILSAGAFNSPQILKLSGIGPASELRTHGIEVVADRPGVGKNLQDRYEVGLIYQLNSAFNALKNCAFTGASSDPGTGSDVYKTNGVSISILKRSHPDLEDPDLFMFGSPSYFHGFYPGYSQALFQLQTFSWVILKSQTRNRAGQVKLKDRNPHQQPAIHFKYFEDGSPDYDHDRQAMVHGIQTLRRIMTQSQYTRNIVSHEHHPGETFQSAADLRDYVTTEAFGHHASCSNKIGVESDPMAVLDSQFRVYGVNRLRVVDASVFPKIPGWFVVAPIYMVSEKAADVIVAAYR